MTQDKENEVKLGFLEEAEEYLNNIESGLLGLGSGSIEQSRLDAVLRAAHSIKGGAAMMGFDTLSHLAHSLEDFFKVLKAGKQGILNEDLERLFLSSVDSLRHIVNINRQGNVVEDSFLETNINPIFAQLEDRVGKPQPQDEASVVSQETGEDMAVLLFETEVEACLQRLTEILTNPENPCLKEEFVVAAQELGGLGEMLELSAFSSLCESIANHLENAESLNDIAKLTLEELRRAQALVILGQVQAIPTELDLSNLEETEATRETEATKEIEETEEADKSLDLVLESEDFQQEVMDVFSSLDHIPDIETEVEEETLDDTGIHLPSSINNTKTEVEPLITNENTIRVPLAQLEQLSDLFGELTIERNGLDLQLKKLHGLLSRLRNKVQVLEKSNFRLRTAYDKVGTMNTPVVATTNGFTSYLDSTQFDLLEMDRYSDLHLLSQEVMETIVQIQEINSDLEINLEDTDTTAKNLNRTSKLMETNLTKVRMRPLSDLLARFPRALRDMALQYGKKVELKVRGGSTLIERSILEALSDPLLHLLRNAFDHGIEDKATRQQLGKPEQGTIEISASYRGNRTIIQVKDDGGGIDLNKIRAKVEQMGLDTEDVMKSRDKDLLDLIFEPGFSTAAKVTDLSGRGVGMDIVRTNLHEIRGEIDVDTKLGVGTSFNITVPFTLSVVRVLLVESEGMLLAFPTNAVEEMLIFQPEMVLLSAGKEILNWEGFMVPLIRLNQWLKFPRPHQIPDSEAVPIINQPTILMIAQGDDIIGIEVDRYWGEQEVTIRQVEGKMTLPPGFSGCTILGDGRIVPLVDAIALLTWIENFGRQPRTNININHLVGSNDSDSADLPSPPSTKPGKNIVMVVDDSINVRRFLALTLEKAGYRVEQAKDGQEALEKLQGGIAAQAVICDIEMPRLDGYGFLAHVKTIKECKHIPTIMLTSRSGDKHRQLAMNLGATDYFTKPFKEQELLQTLSELIGSDC